MRKHVYGLDLLRALAIALVVVQHAALFFYLCYGSPKIWTKTGDIGVTLFFALSGYLIGDILIDQGSAMGDARVAARFWLRRALRTLPSYVLFIGVNVGFWYAFQRARGYPSPWPLLPRYFLFLQNFAATQAWFFPESWSLSVEEWVYVAFPLFLYAGLRLRGLPFGRVYWVLTLVMIALPVVLRGFVLTSEDWRRGITKVVIYRPDSIAVGLAAVGISRAYPAAWSRLRLPTLVLGLAALLASLAYMGWGDPDYSALARTFLPLFTSLGCVLLLPWASTCADLGASWADLAVRGVARWSYSLYLVNLMLSSTVLSHEQFAHGTVVGLACYVGACLALGAALYHGFEAPILRWRDSKVPLGAKAGRRPGFASG
jgi:peptidoglycan/LPS O-acetylase OafA/YrhL